MHQRTERGEKEIETDLRPAIGYLWETPLKAGERCILRQVTGHTRFRPIVFSSRHVDGSRLPVDVAWLRRRPFRKLYRKYVLRAPRHVYNQVEELIGSATKDYGIRLLHVFFGHRAIVHLSGLRKADMPISVSFHGMDVSRCRNDADLRSQLPGLFETADCIMARSAHMADQLAAAGCPRSKLWLCRTSIPVDQFSFRERERGPDDPAVFLQVCRLIAKKGLRDTLRAFGLARRELPGAELWIAGDGPLRAELVSTVKELGLGDGVKFLGFLDHEEMLQAMHRAHVFVHPSVTTETGDQEGIPNSMLEGMATGLAPIATRHAGIPEVVEEGRTGWLVEERAVDRLAERMVWCARNPAALRAVGTAARRIVEEQYSLVTRMRLLDEKFGELIEEHAGAATRERLAVT